MPIWGICPVRKGRSRTSARNSDAYTSLLTLWIIITRSFSGSYQNENQPARKSDRSQNKASELLNGINKYYSTSEEKIAVNDEKKDYIVRKVEEYCKNNGYNYLDIDGVKVLYDDGFALVRKSNTGPHLTFRYEAKSEEKLI